MVVMALDWRANSSWAASDPRIMPCRRPLPTRCSPRQPASPTKNLRVLIAGLLGSDYRPSQLTYACTDSSRRIPAPTGTCSPTTAIRTAVFYPESTNRLLVPLTAADQPQAPPDLRAALSTIDKHVDQYATRARLPQTA
jgi:hypothetical protein